MGNVYLALLNNAGVLKYTPSGNTYTTLSFPSQDRQPFGVAVDARGDVYVADVGNRQVMKADFGDAPSFNFARHQVRSTSADSPKIRDHSGLRQSAADFRGSLHGPEPQHRHELLMSNDSGLLPDLR